MARTPIHARGSLPLPRFGVLALVTVLPVFIVSLFGNPGPVWGGAFASAVMLVSIVYLAWMTLRSIEFAAAHDSLSRLDAWICRRSGPLAWGIGLALLSFAIIADAATIDFDVEPVFLRSRAVLQLIHFVMEVGFVLAITCIGSPRTLGHVISLALWKLLCAPLLVIYGLYVVLIPVSVVASTLGDW